MLQDSNLRTLASLRFSKALLSASQPSIRVGASVGIRTPAAQLGRLAHHLDGGRVLVADEGIAPSTRWLWATCSATELIRINWWICRELNPQANLARIDRFPKHKPKLATSQGIKPCCRDLEAQLLSEHQSLKSTADGWRRDQLDDVLEDPREGVRVHRVNAGPQDLQLADLRTLIRVRHLHDRGGKL